MGILIVVFAVLLICCCIYLWNRRWTEEFNKRFPPISDDEFVARCAPGANPQVALKVRRILAESLAVEYERIYPSSRLMGDLGAD